MTEPQTNEVTITRTVHFEFGIAPLIFICSVDPVVSETCPPTHHQQIRISALEI